MYDNPGSNEIIHCFFYGETQGGVGKIATDPGVHICNECIDLCKEIINEEFYEGAVHKSIGVPRLLEILEVLNNYVTR